MNNVGIIHEIGDFGYLNPLSDQDSKLITENNKISEEEEKRIKERECKFLNS